MKNVFLILTMVIFLISCNKEDNNEPAPADAAIAKYLFDATKDEVDQQLNQQGSLNGLKDISSGPRTGCASVAIAPSGNIFPKTVTIVFPPNCKTFAGASIEGTVTINISGKVRDAGTSVSFALSNFKYKDYIISGNYNITINNAFSHTTVITDGKVTTPDNKTITYTTTNNSTQIEGISTTFKTNPTTFLQDDAYSISTTSSGINSKGNAYAVSTEIPLIYRIDCQWIISGKINISEESRPKITAAIDYGDGTCDNKAILTVNNTTKEILLP
jgi:hypothetical protein